MTMCQQSFSFCLPSDILERNLLRLNIAFKLCQRCDYFIVTVKGLKKFKGDQPLIPFKLI